MQLILFFNAKESAKIEFQSKVHDHTQKRTQRFLKKMKCVKNER